MQAAVVPKIGGKFQVTVILMSLIVTAGSALVQRGENSARKSDRVIWSDSHNHWTIAGMEQEA
jgi:hypothetical protein